MKHIELIRVAKLPIHFHHQVHMLFPGDYLSMISCYYQVLIEVPRPTVARGIRLGLWVGIGLGLSLVHNTLHSYAPRAASVLTMFVLNGSERDVRPTTPLISTCSYRGCGVVRKSVTMDVDDDFRLLLVVALSLALRSL